MLIVTVSAWPLFLFLVSIALATIVTGVLIFVGPFGWAGHLVVTVLRKEGDGACCMGHPNMYLLFRDPQNCAKCRSTSVASEAIASSPMP